jgi:hypothetical protein
MMQRNTSELFRRSDDAVLASDFETGETMDVVLLAIFEPLQLVAGAVMGKQTARTFSEKISCTAQQTCVSFATFGVAAQACDSGLSPPPSSFGVDFAQLVLSCVFFAFGTHDCSDRRGRPQRMIPSATVVVFDCAWRASVKVSKGVFRLTHEIALEYNPRLSRFPGHAVAASL